MKQYLELVNEILTNGKLKPNRTGIDTLSITGAMLKFDLSSGKFPLLTTKKMGVKSIFAELEMFIKGIQSKKFLQSRGCTIWNEWCNPQRVPYGHDEGTKTAMANEDDLGRIFPYQFHFAFQLQVEGTSLFQYLYLHLDFPLNHIQHSHCNIHFNCWMSLIIF